ncbi:T9SS type B sorting domain-containing protein, partial [Solitalea koreensis]
GIPAGNAFPVGSTTVTWSVTDIHGNTSTQTQEVTVNDTEKPVLAAPAAVTQSADAGACTAVIALTAPSATDNCGIAAAGVTSSGIPAGNAFPVGSTTVTWSVTDIHGNTSTQTQAVTVNDREKPVKPVLADVTGECSATASVPTTYDNCKGLITGTTTDALTYTTQGTHVITWSFDDGNGNIETAIQNVVVKDITKPTITAPQAIISQGSNTGSSIKLGTPITSDNCGVATVTNNAPRNFPVGTTTVIWTVTDVNGLTATDMQSVTIVNLPPVVPDRDLSTLMNTPINVDLLSQVSDPDAPVNINPQGSNGSSTIKLTDVTQPAHGTVVIGADNRLIYTPVNGFYGTDIVYYTACDGGSPNLCKTGRLAISVADNYVDLSVNKTTSSGSVKVNEEYDYTIVVSNLGHVTANDVLVTDPLPESLAYVSSNATNGQATYDRSSHKVIWNLQTLNVNGPATLTLKVRATKGGIIVNSAEVIANQPDLDPINNRSQVDKTVLGFEIPNVFTPNGDGFNDNFVINGIDGIETELVVISRWGNEVYKNTKYKNDWNGSQLSEGTYFYVLTVKAVDAKSVKYSGYVTILR